MSLSYWVEYRKPDYKGDFSGGFRSAVVDVAVSPKGYVHPAAFHSFVADEAHMAKIKQLFEIIKKTRAAGITIPQSYDRQTRDFTFAYERKIRFDVTINLLQEFGKHAPPVVPVVDTELSGLYWGAKIAKVQLGQALVFSRFLGSHQMSHHLQVGLWAETVTLNLAI